MLSNIADLLKDLPCANEEHLERVEEVEAEIAARRAATCAESRERHEKARPAGWKPYRKPLK